MAVRKSLYMGRTKIGQLVETVNKWRRAILREEAGARSCWALHPMVSILEFFLRDGVLLKGFKLESYLTNKDNKPVERAFWEF